MGPDYCHFKVKGEDGNLYILRMDIGRAEWELTMFQSAQQSPLQRSSPQESGSGG
jgi:hypothetical protein